MATAGLFAASMSFLTTLWSDITPQEADVDPPRPVPACRSSEQDVARRVVDAGVGLGLSGLPTGNISSGDIRDAVADIVSDPSFRGSASVLSGVLRWGKNRRRGCSHAV